MTPDDAKRLIDEMHTAEANSRWARQRWYNKECGISEVDEAEEKEREVIARFWTALLDSR